MCIVLITLLLGKKSFEDPATRRKLIENVAVLHGFDPRDPEAWYKTSYEPRFVKVCIKLRKNWF